MSEAGAAAGQRRRRLGLLVRLVVLGLLVVWVARYADRDALLAAIASIPPKALAVGAVIGSANVVLGAWRWRLLMGTLGAERRPSLRTMTRLALVGQFYNTFVPGAVGGDLVRGYVTRAHFRQAATGFVVVVLDRLLGLSGLVLVFLTGLVIGPPLLDASHVRSIGPWLGFLAGLGLAAAAAVLLSGRFARLRSHVPRVERPWGLLAALGLSVLGHAGSIAIMVLLAVGMGLDVGVRELMLVVPLGLIAAAVPLAIAGVGPREAAMVGVLGLLGVAREPALALSLGYTAILIGLAALGGLVHLVGGRLTSEAEP